MKPKDLTLKLFTHFLKEQGIYENVRSNCAKQMGFNWDSLYRTYISVGTDEVRYSPLAFTKIGFLWTNSKEGNEYWSEQEQILMTKIKNYSNEN